MRSRRSGYGRVCNLHPVRNLGFGYRDHMYLERLPAVANTEPVLQQRKLKNRSCVRLSLVPLLKISFELSTPDSSESFRPTSFRRSSGDFARRLSCRSHNSKRRAEPGSPWKFAEKAANWKPFY